MPLGYSEARGTIALRSALAATYNSVSPDQILVTTGAIEANFLLFNVLLDAGIDIDYSCELGICGACEQRVISGIPEHRDSILSEEEQAENKRVMICCAGSKSDRLVLDL